MSGPSILIVDDEPIIVQNMVYIFEDCGFESMGASNAARALEYIEKEKFDFIITDIRLPDQSGVDLILKTHSLQPGTRILLHTGANHFELTPELKECGISPDDVLLKPLTSVRDLAESLMAEYRKNHQSKG